MRILTDQLDGHIQKVARNKDIPIHWWPSEGGGTDGAKSKFVEQKYANTFKGKSFYTVTQMGWKWLWLSICAKLHFKNPMISGASKNRHVKSAEQPSQIEAAYSLLNEGLEMLTQELAIIS